LSSHSKQTKSIKKKQQMKISKQPAQANQEILGEEIEQHSSIQLKQEITCLQILMLPVITLGRAANAMIDTNLKPL
jgi:uncharacterized membrane protein required for colicin V production